MKFGTEFKMCPAYSKSLQDRVNKMMKIQGINVFILYQYKIIQNKNITKFLKCEIQLVNWSFLSPEIKIKVRLLILLKRLT